MGGKRNRRIIHVHDSIDAVDVEPTSYSAGADVDFALVIADQELDAPSQNASSEILNCHTRCVDSGRPVVAGARTSDISQIADPYRRILRLCRSWYRAS